MNRRELSQKWHHAINRHCDALREFASDAAASPAWHRYMYEARKMSEEVPRMARLFAAERQDALTKQHRQCSHSTPVPVEDNHLTCCLGVDCRACPALLALDKIAGASPEEIDVAKAWTCAAHIVSRGGDVNNEGYLLTTDDLMYWSNLYESLAGASK